MHPDLFIADVKTHLFVFRVKVHFLVISLLLF